MENACRWLSTVDDKPGVCQHSIESLRKHIQEDPNNYNTCTLMIDEMSIKKQTTWVPCCNISYIATTRHNGYHYSRKQNHSQLSHNPVELSQNPVEHVTIYRETDILPLGIWISTC